MKICSLRPGATEIVSALGLADRLVGISHACDFPPTVKQIPIIVRAIISTEKVSCGNIDHQLREPLTAGEPLYSLDQALFLKADPDLVITQDLCHVCALPPSHLAPAIQSLPRSPTVLSLQVTTLEGILQNIQHIGEATRTTKKAGQFIASLRARLSSIEQAVRQYHHVPHVACLERLEPFYVAGHWISEMVNLASSIDVLGKKGAASRRIEWEELVHAKPDILIMIPCGFTLNRSLREFNSQRDRFPWDIIPALQSGRAFAVDAVPYFSRPGPRLVDGVELLATLFHSDGKPKSVSPHASYPLVSEGFPITSSHS